MQARDMVHDMTLYLIKQTRFVMEDDGRAISRKICKPELWFLCLAVCLIKFFNCVKLYQNI